MSGIWVKKGGTWSTLKVPNWEDCLDALGDLGGPKGSYPESSIMLSSCSVKLLRI